MIVFLEFGAVTGDEYEYFDAALTPFIWHVLSYDNIDKSPCKYLH